MFAEWAGAERGLGRVADHRERPARDRARVRRHAPALPARHRPLRRLRAARAAGGRPGSHAPNPEDHDPPPAARDRPARLSACRLLAACGEKEEPQPAPRPAATEQLRPCSTTSRTPTTPGIYAAQAAGEFEQAGLDVEITPPPDPSAPLQAAAGRARPTSRSPTSPSCCSRATRARSSSSVGALVQKPLTSLMAVGKAKVRTPQDLRGKRVGTAGHPVPVRVPEDDPRDGRRRPGLGQGDQRRLQPRAGDAVGQGRRDARRVLELRGRRPRAARQGPGDPADGGARRADLLRARVRRAPARTSTRTFGAQGAALHAGDRARARRRCRTTRRSASTRCWRPTRASTAGCRRRPSRRRCRCSSPRTTSSRSATRTPRSGRPTPTGCSRTT